MSIPLAVSPSTVTPGLYLVVNLLAGTASPGTGTLRVALMAPKSSAGDLTVDTEVRAGGGEESAATAFGTGTPGHLAAKVLYAIDPLMQVDFIAPTAGATASVLDITAGGSPTADSPIDVDIHGEEFETVWYAAETADNIRDRLVTEISSRTSILAVSAATNGGGVCRVTGKVLGNISEDIKVKFKLRNAQSGSETLTGALVLTALNGGTTDPTFATALTSISGREYHIILPVLSNVDAASTSANFKRVVDHINLYNEGSGALLQQAVVGYTGSSIATAITSVANRNDVVAEMIMCMSGRGLPGVLAAREVAGRIKAEKLDPAANRIGEVLTGYVGSADPIGDKPTAAEAENALTNGVAIVSYNSSDEPVIVRPITTHSLDTAGGADRRCLDVQNVSATYIIARDLRGALPIEFANAKIQRDSLAGEDPPPAGVTEERDVKAFCISQLRFWERKGTLLKTSLDEAIEGGTLIVQVNESDATQVDIVLPFKIVPPLAKMGVVVQRQPA